MRKLLLILPCITMCYYLTAQETVKQKEIGLVFSGLDNFGLTFRTGTNKSLWRFNTVFISGNRVDNSADSLVINNSRGGFGIKIGKEFRKDLAEKLELRFGADLSFNYHQSNYDYFDKTIRSNYRKSENITYQPGINLVFGLNYRLNNNFVLGAELLPNFSYITGSQIERGFRMNVSGFSYGLSNTSVLLSLAHRF